MTTSGRTARRGSGSTPGTPSSPTAATDGCIQQYYVNPLQLLKSDYYHCFVMPKLPIRMCPASGYILRLTAGVVSVTIKIAP
jgi:hypothetical protein